MLFWFELAADKCILIKNLLSLAWIVREDGKWEISRGGRTTIINTQNIVWGVIGKWKLVWDTNLLIIWAPGLSFCYYTEIPSIINVYKKFILNYFSDWHWHFGTWRDWEKLFIYAWSESKRGRRSGQGPTVTWYTPNGLRDFLQDPPQNLLLLINTTINKKSSTCKLLEMIQMIQQEIRVQVQINGLCMEVIETHHGDD